MTIWIFIICYARKLTPLGEMNRISKSLIRHSLSFLNTSILIIYWDFPKLEKTIPESGMNDEERNNTLVHWIMSSMEWGTSECPEQPNEVSVAKTQPNG